MADSSHPGRQVGLSIDSRAMRVETLVPGRSAEKSGNIQVPIWGHLRRVQGGVQGLGCRVQSLGCREPRIRGAGKS